MDAGSSKARRRCPNHQHRLPIEFEDEEPEEDGVSHAAERDREPSGAYCVGDSSITSLISRNQTASAMAPTGAAEEEERRNAKSY